MLVRLKVEGMHCSGCVRAVQRVLSGVDGVEAAVVDLDAGDAQVTARDDVDPAALVAAVDDAGYEARLASDT